MWGRIVKSFQENRLLFKQNRLLGYWESKKYEKMAAMLQKKQDYALLKFNDFPFIYFLINEGDKAAIEAIFNKIKYTHEILADDNNPMTITPLHYAFLEQNHQIVEFLEQKGASLNKTNSHLQNILHLAAIYKREKPFQTAVTKNVDINLVDEFGNTPFHYSARAGSPAMVATLVAARAKKVPNSFYQYPVHMAIESGNEQCINILIDDVGIAYPKYYPIHSASRSGNPAIFERILERKPASINFQDHKGLTPLHHAVIVEDVPMVTNLLKHPQILIDKQDEYGNTALHLAAMNTNYDLLQILIEKGADLDIVNQDNLSPVDYGMTSKSKPIHSLLIGAGSKSEKVKQWSRTKF